MDFVTGNIGSHRDQIAQFIKERKEAGEFKVIDVGGTAHGWPEGIVDTVVDINAEDSDTNFKMDICDDRQWERILKYTQDHGKFDYCICSHTLEDVYNPYLSLRLFPVIAKAGVIMVPYYTTELSSGVELPNSLGYIHHRYLFKERNGKILIAPKQSFLEVMINHKTPKPLVNFKVDWEGAIEYEMFMDNYLGPNTHTIVNNFVQEFS